VKPFEPPSLVISAERMIRKAIIDRTMLSAFLAKELLE